ncbi:outer membrane lipoprotein chaperone LolA [Pseudomaricurvus alcaniphilus]|uniref:outer membrane lipoprotein chaperone LolA n=1 Tax=Pseudomaricurvus alcaniphilus TaxID=1166482 RepID=UPI00140DA1FE|nr:outer membrane lipoprotein chaperone LolA [Pseudomaricurvus alcaniphilus]NHN35826.1 outer membrane lipoprotein chaperone LolA [Pseudomaricurvus alcaniphilus]
MITNLVLRGRQLVCAGLLSLVASLAAADAAVDSAEQLIALLQPMVSMSGEFNQVQSDSNGELLSESSGVFSVRRPGYLRWETRQPFPQLLVSDGATLWLYDPDLEQATISAVDDQLNQSPAVIFSGDPAAIRERFEVSRAASGEFSLTPRQQDGHFRRLDLNFDKRQLVGMTILDGFGQQTNFRFAAMDYGRDIPLTEFQFTPPAGTDILRHE